MPRLRRLVLALLVVGLVTGCGRISTTLPPPTPADFPDLASTLALGGLRIDDVVSGDAGCDDPVLIPTAIGFDASGLDQETPVRMRIFIFRNRDSFDRLRETVDDCARAFITDPETLESIDESPYVVVGQGPWGESFEDALRKAVTKAAGTGG